MVCQTLLRYFMPRGYGVIFIYIFCVVVSLEVIFIFCKQSNQIQIFIKRSIWPIDKIYQVLPPLGSGWTWE